MILAVLCNSNTDYFRRNAFLVTVMLQIGPVLSFCHSCEFGSFDAISVFVCWISAISDTTAKSSGQRSAGSGNGGAFENGGSTIALGGSNTLGAGSGQQRPRYGGGWTTDARSGGSSNAVPIGAVQTKVSCSQPLLVLTRLLATRAPRARCMLGKLWRGAELR